jgi:serine/threonine protein kinase
MIKDNTGRIEDFENEVKVLQHLRHPNIVQFLGICVTDEYVYYHFLLILGSNLL